MKVPSETREYRRKGSGIRDMMVYLTIGGAATLPLVSKPEPTETREYVERYQPVLDKDFRFEDSAETDAGSVDETARFSWVERVIGEILRLQKLPENWDSYGALRIDDQAAVIACYLIRKAAKRANIPEPTVVPTSIGGIQLEWHTSGIDFELEVLPPNYVNIYWEDQFGQNEQSYEFPFDDSLLDSFVTILANRAKQKLPEIL